MAKVSASDGISLYAEAHGDGPPVLLSCGLNTTHVNFQPQIEAITAAGHRLVLWDYRGHGQSDAPDDPAAYSMDQVIDDLGRVLDWASPGEAAVVGGHSFGGLASLHFALRHPERVSGLVLLSTGPGFKNPKAQAGWEAQLERTASYLVSKGMEVFVASRGASLAIGPDPELPAARAAAAAIAAQDPKGLAHFGRRVAGPAPPVIDELSSIEIPALIVIGEKDEGYLRAADVMEAKLPRAEKVVVSGAGHVLSIEAPEAFNAALVKFLRDLD